MSIGQFIQPDHTSQNGINYKINIDNSIALTERFNNWFAPHEQTNSPNMTIRIESGFKIVNGSVVNVPAQDSILFSAPINNSRIDRVGIDLINNQLVYLTGAESPNPVPPEYLDDIIPICQISLSVGQTAIENVHLIDERVFFVTPDVLTAGGVGLLKTLEISSVNPTLRLTDEDSTTLVSSLDIKNDNGGYDIILIDNNNTVLNSYVRKEITNGRYLKEFSNGDLYLLQPHLEDGTYIDNAYECFFDNSGTTRHEFLTQGSRKFGIQQDGTLTSSTGQLSLAWVIFSSIGGVVNILGSYNVSAVSRVSPGIFDVFFQTPLVPNYGVNGFASDNTTLGESFLSRGNNFTRSSSAFGFGVQTINRGFIDSDYICINFFGRL